MSSTRSSHTAGSQTSPREPRRTHRRLGSANSGTSMTSSSSTTPDRSSRFGRRTDQRRSFRTRRGERPRGRCARISPDGPMAAGCQGRPIRRGRCDAVRRVRSRGSHARGDPLRRHHRREDTYHTPSGPITQNQTSYQFRATWTRRFGHSADSSRPRDSQSALLARWCSSV